MKKRKTKKKKRTKKLKADKLLDYYFRIQQRTKL
jgi:hypothetical protein